jgi:hypothetical protein
MEDAVVRRFAVDLNLEETGVSSGSLVRLGVPPAVDATEGEIDVETEGDE